MDIGRTLTTLYHDSPAAFSSAHRLYLAARRTNPKVTLKHVEKWLRGQDAYTLHRRANRRIRAEPRVYAKGIDKQWAMDLCDMSRLARWNDGNRYILTCIDVFSKFAWAQPLRNKGAVTVAEALRKILAATERQPVRIETDKGTEFYNVHFRRLCREVGAEHFSSNSRHKSAVVERFNRTLKTILYRMFTQSRTYEWVERLEKALYIYNNRYHRSIKMKPVDVHQGNAEEVYQNLYGTQPSTGKLLEQGQLVRISKVKHIFEKGYLPNYTEEVFRITTVKPGRPHQYVLTDLLEEELEGNFVSEELSPVDKDDDAIWRIEKVIKRDRNGRYFVKWLGFPAKFNSWVDQIIE
jgi:transposase InsO family protein